MGEHVGEQEQHGLIVARAQPEPFMRAVRKLVRDGTYLKLARGVYIPRADYTSQPPWKQHRLRALALGTSGIRVIGGRSAALLWGMWTLVDKNSPVEYYVARGRKDTTCSGRKLTGRLSTKDYVQGQHVAITNIAQTALDLARFHGFEDCFMSVCWALKHRSDATEELRHAATRSPMLAQCLQLADPHLDSAAEAYFLAQVRHEGLVDLAPQVELIDARGVLRRVDFYVRGTRIVIEISGLGKYGDTEDKQRFSIEKATNRLDALVTAGYRVWAYSAKQAFSGYAYRDVLRRLQLHHKK